MTGKTVARRGQFREAPLVAFTAAAVAGAGIAAARLPAWALGVPPGSPGRAVAAAVLVLLCGGLLFSIRHLGRPGRMAQALRRAGASALSTEVTFALLAAGAALGLVGLPLQAVGVQVLWIIAAVSAAGLLVSLAWVYWLPGQVAWQGVPALSPIPLALLFGLVAQGSAGLAPSESFARCVVALVVVDAAAWAARCAQVERQRHNGVAVQPVMMAQRHWMFAVRFFLVSLPPLFAPLFGAGVAVLMPMGLGILVDRFAFYALAVRQTPEHEVARVGSLIKILSKRVTPPG